MPDDPTFLIIRTSLLAVFGVFVMGVAIRSVFRGRGAGTKETSAPLDTSDGMELAVPPPLPETGVPIRHYRPLDFVWMMFLFLVFAAMSLSSSLRTDPVPVDAVPSAADIMVAIVLQVVLVGVTMMLIRPRIGLNPWLGLRWRSWPWVFLIGPAAVVGMLVTFAVIGSLGYVDWVKSVGADPVQSSVRLFHGDVDPATLAWLVFAAVIVAPVCEEIVFRGYLYPAAKRFAGTAVAAFCSSLLFSVAHGHLAAVLPLFIFGLVQVVLYEKTRSIWTPIVVHLLFNGTTVAVQLLNRRFNFLPEM